jgi:hypothetical protein
LTTPRARLRPGKYNSPEVLDRIATKVYEAAQREGARIALIGGFAMQYYDAPHLTRDVDFVADKGFPVGEYQTAIAFGGQHRIVEGVVVDLIVRSDEYRGLYEEALERAEGIEGVPYLVVSPEYLVAMKMVSQRKKDEEHLSFLFTDVELDWALTEDVVRRHLGPHSVKMLRDLRAEAQWRKDRGR